MKNMLNRSCGGGGWIGGWVIGLVGWVGWEEEEKAVRMSCCG